MDMVERVIREATAKSKDGRIDQTDFLNYSAASTRYGLFSPMEAAIIFHFASRGNSNQRLALLDFASLLDPRWQSPADSMHTHVKPRKPFLESFFESAYNFCLGGLAGGFGASMVYPIDLGERCRSSRFLLSANSPLSQGKLSSEDYFSCAHGCLLTSDNID